MKFNNTDMIVAVIACYKKQTKCSLSVSWPVLVGQRQLANYS